MQPHIPAAQSATLSHAGQMVNIEQPDLFNEAVIGFLESVSPGSAN